MNEQLNNLSTIRKSLRLTQVQVANDLKIGQSTLSQYERGERRIDDVMLRAFSNYYGVSTDEILNHTQVLSISKMPKDLKKILDEEEITLNGRLMSPEDKEKMLRIIEAAYWDAKEMNKHTKD